MKQQPQPEPETEQPQSQSMVNKVIHRLRGQPLTYTVTVHVTTGRAYEMQTDNEPTIVYDQNCREPVLQATQYNAKTLLIVPYRLVELVLCEKNP